MLPRFEFENFQSEIHQNKIIIMLELCVFASFQITFANQKKLDYDSISE